MSQVLDAIEETAGRTMPKPKENPRKPKIPEWKEDVEPLKENAHFWHSVWLSAGKPINCHLHTIMKKTRNQYHLLLGYHLLFFGLVLRTLELSLS